MCTEETREYVGMLDVADILNGLIRHLYPEFFAPNGKWLEEHPRLGIAEITAVGAEFGSKPIGTLLHGGELWFRGDADTSLARVLEEGFRVKIPPKVHSPKHALRVHHRISVFEILPGEQTLDGPVPEWRITDVVSQFDVLRFVAAKAKSLVKIDPVLSSTLSDLGLVQGSVVTVSASMPVILAFACMHVHSISGIGITAHAHNSNPNCACPDVEESTTSGPLLGNLSISDLRGLTLERYGLLALPLGTYILEHHGIIQWEDALVGHVPPAVKEEKWEDLLSDVAEKTLLKASPNATLSEVLLLMVEQGKHRVYVCQKDGTPVGVVTPTDILRTLISQ